MSMGFGIVGCGMISDFHARAIRDVRGGKLVACYNRTAAPAQRLAEKFGCRWYDDLDRFLADPDLNIVTIGTPSGAQSVPGTRIEYPHPRISQQPQRGVMDRLDLIDGQHLGRRQIVDHIAPWRLRKSAPGSAGTVRTDPCHASH